MNETDAEAKDETIIMQVSIFTQARPGTRTFCPSLLSTSVTVAANRQLELGTSNAHYA